MRTGGSVAYFLYDFKTALPGEKTKEFRRLLNLLSKKINLVLPRQLDSRNVVR